MNKKKVWTLSGSPGGILIWRGGEKKKRRGPIAPSSGGKIRALGGFPDMAVWKAHASFIAS